MAAAARDDRAVAVVLTHHHLKTRNAKTTHGMLRGPSRYRIGAVVDPDWSGQDAGEVALGHPLGIPVLADVTAAIAESATRGSWVCQ